MVSGTLRFVIPVPMFKDGGEPPVFPDGEKKGQPLTDWQGRPVSGSGVVFFNADDRAYQFARGDGTAVIIIGSVTRDQAEQLVAKVRTMVSDPNALTLGQLKELIRYARETLGLVAIYDSSREFVATKMSKVALDTGIAAFGLHKRDERDICHAVYVPGSGEFQGPAASPQRFADGAVILEQDGNVRLIQPDSFEATYTHPDGRPLRISELAVQTPGMRERSLPPNLVVAALRDEDTDEIVALYDRATATESGIGPVPRSAWQRFVALPHNLNGRDFRVVRHDQRVIALAESSLKIQGQGVQGQGVQGQRVARFCKFVVDPAYRRRGLATALLVDLLEIDQAEINLTFQCLVPDSWQAGLKFVEALGFAHIESEFGMACPQLVSVPTTISSSVVLERLADPITHAADLARIHNAAYRDDVAFRHVTAEEMSSALEGDELWIARDGPRVCAFCQLQPEPGLVWLESIAVDPDCQGSGLGTALAYRALREAYLSANRPVMLNVSSKNPRAISVYERLGFARRRETLRFGAPRNELAAAMRER